MNQDTTKQLVTIADTFSEVAKRVNQSSLERKKFTTKSIEAISQVHNLNNMLTDEIEKVAQANTGLRDKDSQILNNSLIVRANLSRQKELLEDLKASGSITPDIYSQLNDANTALEQNLAEAVENLEKIIQADNEIILHDKVLVALKKGQQKSLKILEQVTQVALDDAERAIEGSASNLERGVSLAKEFQNAQQLIEKKDKAGLEKLKNIAREGWEIATKVNENSKTQHSFAEKVNSFTDVFHKDALTLQEIVKQKHHLFEQNLQTITVLTVITTMKLQKYAPVGEIIDSVEPLPHDRSAYNELCALVDLALRDIIEIGEINYDNTDILEINNKLEHKTVDWTAEETDLYTAIKENVSSMTEATAYPIEGSAQNIVNGKKLEEIITEIINKM